MLVSFFSSNIPLYIQKNPVEKLCKVLEIELIKKHILVSPKFVFEKIKFKVLTVSGCEWLWVQVPWHSLKVLHYIQHDFICQHPGLNKDQISMFKYLVINYFILKYHHTF